MKHLRYVEYLCTFFPLYTWNQALKKTLFFQFRRQNDVFSTFIRCRVSNKKCFTHPRSQGFFSLLRLRIFVASGFLFSFRVKRRERRSPGDEVVFHYQMFKFCPTLFHRCESTKLVFNAKKKVRKEKERPKSS